MRETAHVFACEGESLLGILHCPEAPPQSGILVIVGGPQYRVGSHRQFVEFARDQCRQGRAVFRFDYRGMGDSSGPFLDFEQIELDVQAAMDEFCRRVPSLQKVYCFGLCDAASAALMFAPHDKRIEGMILLNPWVRTAQSEAQATLKHYYLRRLLSADFWRKLTGGGVAVLASLKDLGARLRLSRARELAVSGNFRDAMLDGAQHFDAPVLLILSGEDLTANEFEDLVQQDSRWQQATRRTGWSWQRVAGANHTFASAQWKQQLSGIVNEWLESL